MPKTTWSEMVNAAPTAHLIVAGFSDGEFTAENKYDSDRLRFASNLLVRLCAKLKLAGRYCVAPTRRNSISEIHCAFELAPDSEAVAAAAAAQPVAATEGWASRRVFVLDDATIDTLLAIAGPGDQRGRGRRARERAERERSLY